MSTRMSFFHHYAAFTSPRTFFFGNAWEQYLEVVDAAECFPAANSRLRLNKRAQGTSCGECIMQRGLSKPVTLLRSIIYIQSVRATKP